MVKRINQNQNTLLRGQTSSGWCTSGKLTTRVVLAFVAILIYIEPCLAIKSDKTERELRSLEPETSEDNKMSNHNESLFNSPQKGFRIQF